jgi:hypothetical protein
MPDDVTVDYPAVRTAPQTDGHQVIGLIAAFVVGRRGRPTVEAAAP